MLLDRRKNYIYPVLTSRFSVIRLEQYKLNEHIIT